MKKFGLLLILAFTTFFSSCEKDLYEESINESSIQQNKATTKYLSIDKVPSIISEIKKYNPSYRYLINGTETPPSGRGAENLDLNLTSILEVTDNQGDKTYSIGILNDLDDSEKYYFENLHIYEKNQQLKTILFKYEQTDDSKVFDLKTFTGNINIYDLNRDLLGFVQVENGEQKHIKIVKGCWKIVIFEDGTIWFEDCSGSGGDNSDGELGSGFTDIGDITGTEFGGLNGDNQSSGTTTGGNGPVSGTTNNTNTGLGTNVIVPNPQWPTNASNFNQSKLIRNTLSLLPDEFNWLQNNPSITSEIYTYLGNNLLTDDEQQAIDFANEAIDQMMQNPGLNINMEASANSPAFIDTSTISNLTPEGAKFNAIYNKLTQVPQFKSLFVDMFDGPQTKFNVKFQIANIPDDNGEFVNADTEETSPGNFLVTINSRIMTPAGANPMTNMEIAKTILHESIHAYIMVKALHPTVGAPIPNASNMNLEQLLNAVYPVGTAQHNFMITNMLPTMQSILTPLVNQLTTAPTRAICESIQIGINNQWSWSEYISYLCYQGLEATSEFQNIFNPVYNSQNQIVSGNANYDFYSDYITMGHDILDRIFP